MPDTTFIYFLRDPTNPMKGYVGKSDNPKSRFLEHIRSNRGKDYRTNWIKGLVKRELAPVLEIIDEVPFPYWPQLEVAYIEFFLEQGYDLVNGTSGGDCPPSSTGKTASLATRAKQRLAKLGKPSHMLGKKHTSEAIAKMRTSHAGLLAGNKHPMFGKKHTPEAIEKNRKARLGKRLTEEHRRAISEALKGCIFSEEHCENLRISAFKRKPTKHTAETRAKMSATKKQWWEEKNSKTPQLNT